MKRLHFRPSQLSVVGVVAALALTTSCDGNDTWEKYQEWYEANNNWYLEELNRTNPDGSLYYTQLKPAWNATSGVLIHYHNDRSLTEGNLSPMITSTVATKYMLSILGGTKVDSSYLQTDSLFVTQVSGVITGWQIALSDMRCGDSATVIIPAASGYGDQGSGLISPYSTLRFDMKLVDIPFYEVPSH